MDRDDIVKAIVEIVIAIFLNIFFIKFINNLAVAGFFKILLFIILGIGDIAEIYRLVKVFTD